MVAGLAAAASRHGGPACSPAAGGVVPFRGPHQAGIVTPMPRHTYFIAFDVVSERREDLIRLLQAWTEAAAAMASGAARFDPQADPQQPSAQSGAAVGIPAARLTFTFGFGPSLFTNKDGKARFGLDGQRPEALVDMPHFPGDQLVAERTGGDLSLQACADDPQVVEFAVRRMVKLARDVAVMRWAQSGFSGDFGAKTPRNQMGFKDGTNNVATGDDAAMNSFVWVGDEGPPWMRRGSYMVIRPIRIALDHWDDMKVAFQERSVGREKASGAPLGQRRENDPLALQRTDTDGNPVIPEESHVALSAPENNGGAQILRRAYNYDNGITKIAERWPPWRQLMTFDAGLLFQCYQRDPRAGFIKLFAKMAVVDMLNQFTTHTGSGLFACPPGVREGEFVGQHLFG